MALASLILLRHAETAWNDKRRMQGHRDVPLNEAGYAQARAAAASVAALRPEVIISSDLQRAQVTADAMAAATGLHVRVDKRLRETNLGEWEGLTRDEVVERWPDQWAAWRSAGAPIAPPGGESRVQVAARAAQLVEELDRGPAERVLMVTHSGLIVGLTASLLGLPAAEWNRFIGIGNCHWVMLHRIRDQWRIHTYNGGLGGVVLPSPDEDILAD